MPCSHQGRGADRWMRLYGSILKEEVPPSGSARLEHNKKYAPAAFEDDADAMTAYAAVARNFVSSSEPAGTPLPGRGPFGASPRGTRRTPRRRTRPPRRPRVSEGEAPAK